MKNINRYIGFVAIVALLFTSCTKDENNLPNTPDTELAKLSFAPLLDNLDNLRAESKQAEEIPGCSEAAPSYVEIVLSQDGTDVVGSMGAPFTLSLVANQLFTQEVPELELPPGTYSLDHFAVYDSDDNLIWLAPKTGGSLANFVNDPLPLAINLGAGVKKYVDVSVLCFDDREVNEYGYLFFELNPEVALEFCFFANYCDDTGRHYPGSYSVSIWKGTDNTGELLYSEVPNVTGQYPAPEDDYYATPLCFALPSNEDMAEEYLYYEVSLLDWPEVYGSVSEPAETGTLSMNDIIANLSGEDQVEYEHLRFNCEENGNGECDQTDPEADCDDDGILNNCDTDNPNWGTFDCDGDEVLNADDECPEVAGTAENNGCPDQTCDQTDPEADCDDDGILNNCDTDNPNWGTFDCDGDGVLNGDDECPEVAGTAENNGCPDQTCDQTDPEADCDDDGILNNCDTDNPNWGTFDCDGDGVLNADDECPDVAGTVENNGCPEDSCAIEAPDSGCVVAFFEGNESFTEIVDPGEVPTSYVLLDGEVFIGNVTVTINESGDPVVIINAGIDFSIDDYRIEISQNSDGSNSSCVAQNNISPATGEEPDVFEEFDQTADYVYPFYLNIEVNSCPVD